MRDHEGDEMITGYQYELWNGKEVVGHYHSVERVVGSQLHVFTGSVLKQKYGVKPKTIIVPITTRIISDDGMDVHLRVVLDVRRKSKRQINILGGNLE